MNVYLAAAGSIVIIIGLVHSLLGEVLIFRRMRIAGVVPTNAGRVIGESHVRIIWASWHVVSVLGWLIGAGLIWLSRRPAPADLASTVLPSIALAMLCSGALVLFATKARHPGWAGLLAVAVLVWIGRNP